MTIALRIVGDEESTASHPLQAQIVQSMHRQPDAVARLPTLAISIAVSLDLGYQAHERLESRAEPLCDETAYASPSTSTPLPCISSGEEFLALAFWVSVDDSVSMPLLKKEKHPLK